MMPTELRSRKLVRDAIGTRWTKVSENNNIGEEYDEEKFAQPYLPSEYRIGYRHWFLITIVVGLVYTTVVYLDNRMPDVLPSNQFIRFSESRARKTLNELAGFGPRPSGSRACEEKAVNLILNRLNSIKDRTNKETRVNRMEVDVQHPSGCFDLGFLSSFTLCYRNITNILARFGPPSTQSGSKHALLVNCHFDTIPASPGATDDAVSCAIMLDILEIFSRSPEQFENDVIFLFNGAEENFLQASHGFITSHPWRHSVRAFINLEGAGAGGREMLFQAGPGNAWLLKAYLDNAPHPHCSVLAQEIFQSGIVPSDTDFRVFRDYGRVSGLDIAYVRNGWVYHTEFDLPEFIPPGAIQRAGDNVLAVTRALIRSPYLAHPADYHAGRWVFYDVVGLFTVCYSMTFAQLFNYFVAALAALKVFYKFSPSWRRSKSGRVVGTSTNYSGSYSLQDLCLALLHQLIATLAILGTGLLVVKIVGLLDLNMVWYKAPEIAFPLYFLPCFLAGLAAHSFISERYYLRRDPFSVEQAHYDSMLMINGALLVCMTWLDLASAFYLLLHVMFPLLRDVFCAFFVKIRLTKGISARSVLTSQVLCLLPVIVLDCYAVMIGYEFFVPILGRLGIAFNPEYLIMAMSVLATFSFVLYTSNLLYISRNMWYLLRCGLALFILFLIFLVSTKYGNPFSYTKTAPRLRRLIVQHVKRSVYDFDNNLLKADNGLFIQPFDYRGPDDLPNHTLLQGMQAPDCSKTADEYCQLPYYTAIHMLFPPEQSRWVSLPQAPSIDRPLHVQLLERVYPASDLVNISFSVDGGMDKTSLHVTPLNGYRLKHWSLSDLDVTHRKTYFAFVCYGHYSGPWNFWILLKNTNPNPPPPNTVASVEISVASFYAHGPTQYSPLLNQLRTLVVERRERADEVKDWWKWALTMICGVSQLVARYF